MKTNISCTRCGTVTTWTPYCPSCGAYLEFAGDPPWVPAPPEPALDEQDSSVSEPPEASEPESTTSAPEPAPAAAKTTADTARAVEADTQEEPTEVPDTADLSTPTAAPHPQLPRRHRRRFGGTDPWWRFWDKPEAHAATATPIDTTPPEPQAEHPPEDAFLYVVEAPAVPATVSSESPARQEEAQKRTLPIGRPDDLGIPGGLACPDCRFGNYADATYCARCGLALRTAVPKTWVPGAVLAPSDNAPRRRDWSFVALVALGVFILGVIFFAPPGEPIRQAIGNVIRSFAYWVDPDLGTPVTVTAVSASSTGYGAPVTAVIGDDTRSFWASAPGPSWGAGSTLTFTLEEPTVIDRMVIRPGIQNGQFAVRALATPEGITLVFVELGTSDVDTTGGSSSSPSASGSTQSPSGGSPTSSPSSGTPASSASSSTSPSPSPSPTSSASPSPTSTASPTPTPTATPSASASLAMIVEPTDWTSVVSFPAVLTDTIVLRVDSIYPPALPDVYDPTGDGQVAITGIQFLPKWDIGDFFTFTFRETAVPIPTPSSGSASPSPSASPSSSGSGSGSPSTSAPSS